MVRTWVRALGAALLAAAVVGAGQLGIAYGLGVLRWDQRFSADDWQAHLVWVAWIGSLAVVSGAVAGTRTIRRYGRTDGSGLRRIGRGPAPGFGAWIAVSLMSLLGGAAVLPLVALPARASEVPRPLDPALNAGLAAVIGLVVGVFAALAVLCARPVAGSVFVTTCWVWAAGVGSAMARVGETFPRGAATGSARSQRLGVLELPALGDRSALPVIIGMAVLAGLLIAAYARWLGEHPAAVAASGLAGPALIAAAYLVAGQGAGTSQRNPYLAALIGVGAGLAASVAVAVARRRRPKSAVTADTEGEQPEPRTAWLAAPAAPAPAAVPPAGSAPAAAPPADPAPPAAPAPSGPVAVPPTVRPRVEEPPSWPVAPGRDDDYVSWVSGLGDGQPTDELFASSGRRRRDRPALADRRPDPGAADGDDGDDGESEPAGQIPEQREVSRREPRARRARRSSHARPR